MKTGAAFRLLPPVYLSVVTRLSEVTLELAALDVAEVLAGLVELGATPASALLDIHEVGVEPSAMATDSANGAYESVNHCATSLS